MTRDELRAALDRLAPGERADLEDLLLEAFFRREAEERRRLDPEGEAERDRQGKRLLEVCGDLDSPKARAAIREACLALLRYRLAETPGA